MGSKVRWLVVVGLTAALGACESLSGAQSAVESDLTLARSGAPATDLALAALAKGDTLKARVYVERALQANGRDPYALLAAGLLYQNTNQPVEAVKVYQTLIALAPQEQAAVGSWFKLEKRPLTEIAAGNLEILAMLPEAAAATQVAAKPGPAGDGPRSLIPGYVPGGAPGDAAPAPAAAPAHVFVDPNATTAVMARFLALNRLFADGLITQDDYSARRAANLGALLPLSQPAPAAGLGRPAPTPDEVVARLRTLRSTLDEGSMTQEQHTAERQAILEALLPADPRSRAPLLGRPSSAADAAAARERAQAMRAAGLITPAELAAETAAIGHAPRQQTKPTAAGATGIHLASYKSEAAAKDAWKELTARFPALRALTPRVVRADLGAKGVFHRLEAGPVSSPTSVCSSLKSAGQYCAPISL